MKQTYLNKLEYFKIINILSGYCKTYVGKNLVANLVPSNNKDEVLKLLQETEEAVNLTYRISTAPMSEIANISENLLTLESFGVLSIKSILEIKNILQLSQELKNYFYTEAIDTSSFTLLEQYFSKLYTNKSIVEKISKIIIDENTIADDASSNLKNIRRKQRNLEQDIKDKLNSFIHSSSYSKYIQENIITIKNDRYVIPVKEEYRSMIKGFVHDISSSGSTVFIEPISIFETNNDIYNLKIEEHLEIEKILKDLSLLLSPITNELKTNIETIGYLDYIFAKSSYSKDIKGITPNINDNKNIKLINAKHPLIDQNKVVPISVNIGEDFSTLVITGPNTGGKTVTLKTIGLLVCMACSGLNIPADEQSSIFVFDEIFADIGDDQSISESLSTFSAHMTNIVDIVNTATDKSLILLDELASGTDPLEGANLAISILDYFKNINALTISTTHYQELKEYALLTKGVKNASVEFNLETLSPTYKLLIGVPGKSNAFEISKKLGLKQEIITYAKSMLNSDDVSIEELLKNIYDNKAKIEAEKQETEKYLEEVKTLKASLIQDNSNLEKQKIDLINNAKIEARKILLNAKDEANEIIKNLNNSSNIKTQNNLRNKLNNDINSISLQNYETKSTSNALDISQIKQNETVFVTTLKQNGIVLSNISKSNEVIVQVGSIKMNIPIKYLEKAHKETITKKDTKNYTSISKTRNAKTEINVIGYTVEEATFVVDKFLDDCALAKIKTVRIVHGKGTGKLKNGIHQFLKNHPHVASYRMGTYGEGEMGVTVVEVK